MYYEYYVYYYNLKSFDLSLTLDPNSLYRLILVSVYNPERYTIKKTFALTAAFVHKNALFPGFSCVFFTCHVTSPVMFSFFPFLSPLTSDCPLSFGPCLHFPLPFVPCSCNFPYFSPYLFCQPSLL
jgi:hypothetical protein